MIRFPKKPGLAEAAAGDAVVALLFEERDLVDRSKLRFDNRSAAPESDANRLARTVVCGVDELAVVGNPGRARFPRRCRLTEFPRPRPGSWGALRRRRRLSNRPAARASCGAPASSDRPLCREFPSRTARASQPGRTTPGGGPGRGAAGRGGDDSGAEDRAAREDRTRDRSFHRLERADCGAAADAFRSAGTPAREISTVISSLTATVPSAVE